MLKRRRSTTITIAALALLAFAAATAIFLFRHHHQAAAEFARECTDDGDLMLPDLGTVTITSEMGAREIHVVRYMQITPTGVRLDMISSPSLLGSIMSHCKFTSPEKMSVRAVSSRGFYYLVFTEKTDIDGSVRNQGCEIDAKLQEGTNQVVCIRCIRCGEKEE